MYPVSLGQILCCRLDLNMGSVLVCYPSGFLRGSILDMHELRPPKHGTVATILLHLTPGLLLTAGYILIAPHVLAAGWPSLTAFLMCVTCVSVPSELLVLTIAARRAGTTIQDLCGKSGIGDERVSADRSALIVIILTVLATALLGLLPRLTDPLIHELWFFWLPDWFDIVSLTTSIDSYERSRLMITVLAGIPILGLLGPITEEYYFRGYLLPRIDGNDNRASFTSALLFSIYHLWQPSQLLYRIILMVPWTRIVQRRRSLRLSITIHVIIGTSSMVSMIPLIFLL